MTKKPASPVSDIGPGGYAVTIRVGSVLNADAGLSWLDADAVLRHLATDQHDSIDAAHLALISQHPRFLNAEKIKLADEAFADGYVKSDENGHLYRSSTIVADFVAAQDHAGAAAKILCKVSLALAYTVCVRLPAVNVSDQPKELHSKFWYNVIAVSVPEPQNLDEAKDDIAQISAEIEALGQAVLESTIGFYGAAVNKDRHETTLIDFSSATQNCRKIVDHCVEFADDAFDRDTAKLASGEQGLSGAEGVAVKFMHELVSAARTAESPRYLHKLAGDASIKSELLLQRDSRGAEALYVVTTQGKLDDASAESPAIQRALGVTSSKHPRKRTPDQNSRFRQKYLHANPSNTTSITRITRVAGML